MKWLNYTLQILILVVASAELSWRVCSPLQRNYLIHQLQGSALLQWLPVLARLDRNQNSLLLPGLGAAIPEQPLDPAVAIAEEQTPAQPGAARESQQQAEEVDDSGIGPLGHEPLNADGYCMKPMAPVKVVQKTQAVYRWTDDQGRVHFGDKPLSNAEDLSAHYQGKQLPLQMSVDFPDWQGNSLIAASLEREAHLMYRIISGLIPARQHRSLALNVSVYENFESFDKVRRQRGVGARTGAFYSSDEHHIYLPYESRWGAENAMAVTSALARHEMTHAIATAMLGTLPIWLNEGLAEYMERLQWQMSVALVAPDRQFPKLGRYRVDLAQFTAMSQKQFYQGNKGLHYAQGLALVYFMLGSESGRQWLGGVLERFADSPCHRFDPRQEFASYPGGLDAATREFNQWLAAAQFTTHRY
jgi:hypothetical protein